MDTVTIEKKEYQALKAARARLEALTNRHTPVRRAPASSLSDLVGALRDVPAFKGKTSVEAQHMIPALWRNRRSS